MLHLNAFCFLFKSWELGVVAYTYDPGLWEAEGGHRLSAMEGSIVSSRRYNAACTQAVPNPSTEGGVKESRKVIQRANKNKPLQG